MSSLNSENLSNSAVRCTATSKFLPCNEKTNLNKLFPIPSVFYSGPTPGTTVNSLPVNQITIPVLNSQNQNWFAISDLNASSLPPGGQNILTETSRSTNARWYLGSVSNNSGKSVINRLLPGKYEIYFSLHVSFSGIFDSDLIVALGTHSPGTTFNVDGTPLTTETNIYNVATVAPRAAGGLSIPRELSAKGGLTVTKEIKNIGLIAYPRISSGDMNFTFSTINLSVKLIE